MRRKSVLNRIFGCGLVAPLRRAASYDFVAGEGVALIASSIRQILKTRLGELPWKPEFGVDLEPFRHHNPPAELVATTISEAIRTWEGRVSDIDVQFGMPAPNVVSAIITWSSRSEAQGDGGVLIPSTSLEVPL